MPDNLFPTTPWMPVAGLSVRAVFTATTPRLAVAVSLATGGGEWSTTAAGTDGHDGLSFTDLSSGSAEARYVRFGVRVKEESAPD